MKETIEQAIERVCADLGITEVRFVVEHPADLSHGDYATNVAMVCAKQLGKNPREIAEQFRATLDGAIPHVAEVTIAGPGFINFTLSRDFFSEKIASVTAHPDNWGQNDSQKGEEVVFEYTSPNLFKPLHIGNLVGNIIGESISRLFEYAGANVHRTNYPSDIGLTVAKGVWGLKKTGGEPDHIQSLGEAYRVGNEAYETDSQAKDEIEAVNRALYAGTDTALCELRERGLATSKRRLEELMAVLDTSFDTVIYESEASAPGKSLVLAHTGTVFEESEGAVVYRGEKYGLHTRVFINSQGLPTYEAKDVGHFSLKCAAYPSWTQSYIVTGNEQREYFKVLIAALTELFPDAKKKHIEHIATGFLTLTTGKMSSRKGNVLTGESLLGEMVEEAHKRATESRTDNIDELTQVVAVAALKYQILRQAPGTNIIFDKEKALSFEGDSGPYLQYTHARIASVLEKAEAAGVIADTKHTPEVPYVIEKILYRFEEVVREALDERAPHKVAVYLTELAGAFNTFYGEEKIADASDEHAPYKAAVARAVKVTLKNGLWTLGIKAPERM